MTRPVRLQLSRRQGFRLQPHSRAANGLPAIIVARPTRWGNPWRIGEAGIPDAAEAARRFRAAVLGFDSNGVFCPPIAHPLSAIGWIIENRDRLKAHNLACWCPLDGPCHADVLLELAGGPAQDGDHTAAAGGASATARPQAEGRGTDAPDGAEDR